jgi:hypothetical protein
MRLRPATADDGEQIAEVDLAARREALPAVRWAHTPAEVRCWIGTVLLPNNEVWVAEESGVVLGYLALHDDWVSQLSFAPATGGAASARHCCGGRRNCGRADCACGASR